MSKKTQRIMQYTADVLISLSIFFLLISITPFKTNQVEVITQEQEDIKFVFHASASNRDMFFAEQELDEVLGEDLKKDLVEYLDKEFDVDTGETQEKITDPQKEKIRQCELPRDGDNLKHGESVLAYQQRRDVSSVCNVERRVCKYGELDGSYVQRSCREKTKYSYIEEEVISYNIRPTNLYIQPPKLAPDRNADFSMDGKRNDPLIPIDERNNNINDELKQESDGGGQVKVTRKNCITPRGEEIKHSHFVKAYRSSIGFSNNYCEVELRMCLDGELQGEFQYPYCEHKEIPDEDYIIQELNNPDSEDDEFNIRNLVESTFKN